jgi:hypothetical protein
VIQNSGGKSAMDKTVKKYSLGDPAQELDDKEFWKNQSYEYKILVLESLRGVWSKLNPEWRENGNIKGFRRVLRIVKQA